MEGLGRTKDDIVIQQLKPILLANNFQQVKQIHLSCLFCQSPEFQSIIWFQLVRKSQRARVQLQRLGLFKEVEILIDVSHGEKALSHGYEVTFKVAEKRRLTGEIGSMIGTNEGSMVRTWLLKFLNVIHLYLS